MSHSASRMLFTRIVLTAPAPIGVGPSAESLLQP